MTTNMKTKTTMSPMKMSPLALAGIGLIAACLPSHAAVLSFSAGAPTVNGADISSFTGTTSDAGNVLNGADPGTYVANDQGAQGQTFTTGSNLGGYTLIALTLQHVNYSTFFNLNSTSSLFTVRVGTVAAGAFGSLASETAASGGPGNPGGFTNANGSSLFLTFTLATPLILSPNTVYGFDVGSNGSFFETNGINSNPFAGGFAYSSGPNTGVGNSVATERTGGDRVFHADLAAVPEPSSTLLFGASGMLALLRRRR